jgi:lipopolysaccharide export system permease protein
LKTLHAYLIRQVLATLLMTVAVFTFVLLLGNVLKEIIALLVARQITFGLLLKAIGLLVPYVMAYVLPFGMLTAVVLVFGRFSADQELTAVRASGISLLSVVTPVLLLSVFFCAACALFNMWIAPLCRGAYKDLIFRLGSEATANLITEDRFIDEIPGIDFYTRKKDGNRIEDVLLYMLENGEVTKRVSAKSGRIKVDKATQKIYFELFDGISELKLGPETPPSYPPGFIGPPEPPKPRESEWQPTSFGSFAPEPIDLAPLMKGERKLRISEMNFFQLKEEIARLRKAGIPAMPAIVQLHRQLAFSFACFGFTLVGIPLAIRAHRRETSIGVAIALILVLAYYTFFIVGEALGTKERLRPYLFFWAANFLFQALGAVLLARANRRG